MSKQTRKERILKALTDGLQPQALQVIDESNQHVGHAGAQPEGETHYRVIAVSSLFAGQSKLAQHRLVNALLKDEFDSGLHALALELSAPNGA